MDYLDQQMRLFPGPEHIVLIGLYFGIITLFVVELFQEIHIAITLVAIFRFKVNTAIPLLRLEMPAIKKFFWDPCSVRKSVAEFNAPPSFKIIGEIDFIHVFSRVVVFA